MSNPHPRAIAATCELADGVSPLNDSARLILDGLRDGRVISTPDGFAVLDDHDGTIMLAIAPEARGQGLGTTLAAEALQRRPHHAFWAFHTLPAARAVAHRLGLTAVRELLRMQRPLDGETPSPIPVGYTIRSFQPEDAEQLVAVNAAAFAHHPEQGRLSLEDFLTMTDQPWFDPAGCLVALYDGRLVGFHWTKRHDTQLGEVYVIAVHPDHEGRGLGRALLSAGLAYLEEIGCTRVQLYVEADQQRVVALYQAAGFDIVSTDTSYRA